MQVLDTQLILVFELLELFLWCFFVVLLIFRGRFHTGFELLPNEKYLAVLMINVLGLDFRPGESTKLAYDSGHISTDRLTQFSEFDSLFGKVGLLWQLSRSRATALGILDADNETALILDAQILLYLTKLGWNRRGVDKMCRSIFGARDRLRIVSHDQPQSS